MFRASLCPSSGERTV